MQILYQKCDQADISWLDKYINIRELGVIPEGTPIPDDYQGMVLCFDGDGLSLRLAGASTLPTRVDFLSKKLAHRVETSSRSQGLLKAVGLDKYPLPLHVIDATAGLGSDAWIMAAMGCKVSMLERSPIMAALLQDGIMRARQDADAWQRTVIDRLSLELLDASQFFDKLEFPGNKPDVIYLDPMFPERQKSAKVKKDMALMQKLLPVNDDISALLEQALQCAGKRVVLKRPGKAEKHPAVKPDFQVPGKACHFQVFLTKH